MNNQPLLSVIVPVYKVEEDLEQCINSLLEQTYTNTEILLIDDGSPDNCPAMCDAYAQKHDNVIVFHKPNGGLSSARNYGIERAKGEYIAFIDSDDFADKQMFAVMMKALVENNAQVAICNYYVYYSSEEFSPNAIEEKEVTVLNGEAANNRLDIDFSACNKIYRRELFDSVRYPVGKIFEDARTTYKIADKVQKLVVIPQPFYYYRQRQTSIMNTLSGKDLLDKVNVWDEIIAFEKQKHPTQVPYLAWRKNDSIINSLLLIFRTRQFKTNAEVTIELVKRLDKTVSMSVKAKLFSGFMRCSARIALALKGIKNG